MSLDLHPRVEREVEARLGFIELRGALDFAFEAERLLVHILELEDHVPAKAAALADLAAAALWYANNLRREQIG